MKKFFIVVILIVVVLLPTTLMARTNIFPSFGIGIPAPVFIAPTPVFVAPPVVVAPYYPVIVQPAPVIITPYGQVIKHKVSYKYKPYEYEGDDDDYCMRNVVLTKGGISFNFVFESTSYRKGKR